MSYLYAIVGAVVGGMLAHASGFFFGAGFGWLLGTSTDLRERLSRVERELDWLRKQVAGKQALPERTPAADLGSPAADRQGERVAPVPVPAVSEVAAGQGAPRQAAPAAPGPDPVHAAAALPKRPTLQDAQERPAPSAPESPLVAGIRDFLTGGNLLVKAGIVILFFGVSFLVKYAADRGLIPIELRLAACALGGAALLAIGWRLREERREYALTLQGGGIGVLYLTSYAAFRLYDLIPPFPAFGVLLAVSLLCGVLAVVQDSRTLALFGISGGFLAPLLASVGFGNHVFLFGYYLVLNCGVIGIAWFKAWRQLNLAGFIFTFLVGAIWGASYYQPAYFPSTEPFLVLSFLIYTAVAVLFAQRKPPRLQDYLDGTVVCGTPVVSFALQACLVADYRYGMAWSALAAGLFYCALSWGLSRRGSTMMALAEAFRAFGVIFLTLAIPLACDGRWTAAAWALEGAAIAWIGIRQERLAARVFGYLLQAGAGIAFLIEFARPVGALPVLNVFFLGCLLLSLSGLWTAYSLYRASQQMAAWEYSLSQLLIAWGLFWWVAGGLSEIDRHVTASFETGAQILFIATTCALCHLVERCLSWSPLGWPALGIVPALWCCALLGYPAHPLENGGWLAWPVAFAVLYAILYLKDDEHPEVLPFAHGAALWLFAILATWELGWQVRHVADGAGSWLTISRGIVPTALVLLLAQWGSLLEWPVRRHQETYLSLVAFPLVLWSWLWCILANLTDRGDPVGMAWLPLLNPLDLACALSLGALFLWFRRFKELELTRGPRLSRSQATAFFAATLFLWLNAILVRGLHHWGGVRFDATSMFHSNLAQTSFALLWSLVALCVMVVATRRGLRTAWVAGAGLLGTVVVKLFLIDLAGRGTVERIVSFVAVGLLLLVVGWFSPVPPRTTR